MIQPGTRIRLIHMADDPEPILEGTLGTVSGCREFKFQGGGIQLWVDWDNGRTLSLIVPPDRFEIVKG